MTRCPSFLAALLLLAAPAPAIAQEVGPSNLFPAGTASDLPLVEPNDNTRIAGALEGDTRTVELEVRRGDWRIEGPDGPGLRVAAIGEVGGAPSVPAPLLRVDTNTRLAVTVRNRLATPVTVFGLHARPSAEADSFVVAPGSAETVAFEAGEAGTYLYWMREGPAPDPESDEANREYEQLAGALAGGEAGAATDDRVIVMNIFSEPVDGSDPDRDWIEGLTMNGLSWPFSERMKLDVGEDVRWRVVNASTRNHPMHLHGFYYSVLSRGDATGDTVYPEADRRLVVTETMRGRTTMAMRWTPTRPGKWLFHCHLSFHVAPDIRLPGAEAADTRHGHTHMAGLVTGIEVAPGPTDLVARGEPVALDLRVVELPADSGEARQSFSLGDRAGSGSGSVPGPVLTFTQYQSADVTVHNGLAVPTGVHWHGLELDAWADGVPDWSASDGKVSPVIRPGESFTYRLSFLRPGTFIYHSHLDDVHQLTRGLYGALLVLPEGETYDPRTDHLLVLGWNTPTPKSFAAVDLNGGHEQPDGIAAVGERHRFRLINIAPAGNITAWITRGEETVPITLHAKDGADLPEHQRVPVETLARLFVGETADFTWTPEKPGTYELRVGYAPAPEAHLVQRWVVE